MAELTDYIRFDWAIKRILRDKANFGVLEGLITVLIGHPVRIAEILESESNRTSREDKSNRVDVKAKTEDGETIIVEVQLAREQHFMQRILYGVSKAITEQLKIGVDYDSIKKVYSICILYFNLGDGEDFVYHGVTTFKGMTLPESVLHFNPKEETFVKNDTHVVSPEEVFPEYFLLRVNQFNEVAKTPIEEWMDYLKRGVIRDDTKAPGLQEAREKLDYMKMTKEERDAYEHFMINVRSTEDAFETAIADGMAQGWNRGHAQGLAEGREEGREEGRAQGMKEGMAQGMKEGMAQGMKEGMKEGMAQGMAQGMKEGMKEGMAQGVTQGRTEAIRDMARQMKSLGIPIEVVTQTTGLSEEDIRNLL